MYAVLEQIRQQLMDAADGVTDGGRVEVDLEDKETGEECTLIITIERVVK